MYPGLFRLILLVLVGCACAGCGSLFDNGDVAAIVDGVVKDSGGQSIAAALIRIRTFDIRPEVDCSAPFDSGNGAAVRTASDGYFSARVRNVGAANRFCIGIRVTPPTESMLAEQYIQLPSSRSRMMTANSRGQPLRSASNRLNNDEGEPGVDV